MQIGLNIFVYKEHFFQSLLMKSVGLATQFPIFIKTLIIAIAHTGDAANDSASLLRTEKQVFTIFLLLILCCRLPFDC